MESMIPNIADFADAVKFNGYSWAVIVVYMILTTWLGHRLSGSHATIRDFFLGGRKIPWYAVSGSVIATELSAMTLVGARLFSGPPRETCLMRCSPSEPSWGESS
jgi:hypothetical protein